MNATDRTPVVLALLADVLQDCAADRPDDHDLHALADGVALAVDHGAAAALWPPTSEDDADVEWISNQWKFIDAGLGREEHVTSATRSLEVRIARRLADVAASLRVRGEHMRREAEALWRAASRLLGLDVTNDDVEPAEDSAKWTTALRDALDDWRGWARGVSSAATPATDDPTLRDLIRSSITAMQIAINVERASANTLRLDLASMTEQRDEALRQLADMRREMAGVFRR